MEQQHGSRQPSTDVADQSHCAYSGVSTLPPAAINAPSSLLIPPSCISMIEIITVPVDSQWRLTGEDCCYRLWFHSCNPAALRALVGSSVGSIRDAHCRQPQLAFCMAFGTFSIRISILYWQYLLFLACIAWRGAESEISSRVQPSFRGIPHGFSILHSLIYNQWLKPCFTSLPITVI